MFAKRILTVVVLLPIGLALMIIGGPAYSIMVGVILALAAWEYVQMFQTGGLHPSALLTLGGTVLFVVGRSLTGFDHAPGMVSLVVLAAMAFHLVMYERGRDQSGTDFGVTLGGAFYLGWIGAYLISLRAMPDGLWWVLLALPAVWFADSGAYLIGKPFGRHKITPHLSPKKSWEGYIGGIVAGTLGAALLALAWQALGPGISQWVVAPGPAINPLNAALLGFVLSVLTLLGDLGESMIKRQVGVKDSGKLLPGHGGVFDRIDSWLWAGVLAYYLVAWVFY